MKYCIPYHKSFRYKDIIDEVIYEYDKNIVDIISKEPWKDTQTVIINLPYDLQIDDLLIPTLKMCKKNHNNLMIRLTETQDEIRETLREAKIPYFYSNYAITADEIYSLIKKGASDVYVTESLAFNLIKIGEYCKTKGVRIRIIPNVAQYRVGFKSEIPDPCKFFVRPEDTELYEPYVSVFEISGLADRFSVTYEIYRNKQWIGNLSDLITGFTEDFPNGSLVPYFGPERLKCGQRCMQENCNLCEQMKELAKKFSDDNLLLTREKDKNWKNETESYQKIMQYVEKTTPASDGEIPEGQGVQEDNQ